VLQTDAIAGWGRDSDGVLPGDRTLLDRL